MAVPLTLKVFKGDSLVASKDYERDIIKIGRLSSAHLCLEDEKVSRIHSVIEVASDGAMSIIDMGSVEGTYVNGKRVTKGSQVQILSPRPRHEAGWRSQGLQPVSFWGDSPRGSGRPVAGANLGAPGLDGDASLEFLARVGAEFIGPFAGRLAPLRAVAGRRS